MLPSPAHSVVGGVGGVASDDINNNPGIIDVAGEVRSYYCYEWNFVYLNFLLPFMHGCTVNLENK